MSQSDVEDLGITPESWGLVPLPVLKLMAIFRAKMESATERLVSLDWDRSVVPSDASPFFIDLLRASQLSIDASTDLRALTTAYAQMFHQPRPTLARLAEAQKASSAGLVKRYTPNTVDAINALLSAVPQPLVIERAFRSIALEDLADFSPDMNQAVHKLIEAKGSRTQRTRAGRS